MSRAGLLHAAAAALPFAVFDRLLPSANAAIIEEDAAERIFESAGPSVVSVHTRSTVGNAEGLGSGIVWTERGHLLTSYAVVQRSVTTNSRV